MDIQRRSLQIGAAAVICAIVLRLLLGGLPTTLARLLVNPSVTSFLIYLETGRIVRLEAPQLQYPAESPPPILPETREALRFTAEQGESVSLRSWLTEPVELGPLAEKPLDWDLTGAKPTVLILHTHTSESYTKQAGQDYAERSAYHTMDEGYNMLRVGDAVAERLEQAGIHVIHDRSFHDEPSYTGSYDDAKESIESYLEAEPSIQMILDIHRDAADTDQGQLTTSALVDGQEATQLMLVVGTNEGGLTHPDWQENLALAVKLQLVLEQIAPGITRPISLRKERFNQHESPGSILVEVGAAGDTLPEALRAADVLADAVIALCHGANTQ